MSGVVSHQTLEDTLAGYQDPGETVQQLIQLALRGGGPDNITCIVADVLDIDDSDTLAGRLHDAPVVVGAVADHQLPLSDSRHLQTPAGRASELGRPQAPEGAFGPPGDLAAGGAPLGSFGAFEGEYAEDPADWDKPRKSRRWLKRSAALVVVLGLIGGGLYGAYRWTQTQYYVGVKGDHAAIYQGIEQKLAWVSLSKVHEERPGIELKYLPDYQRRNVEDTIAAGSLTDAKDTADQLEKQAKVCQTKESIDKAAKAAKSEKAKAAVGKATKSPSATSTGSGNAASGSASASASATPSPSASASASTTLSPEDQTLAQQCPSGQ